MKFYKCSFCGTVDTTDMRLISLICRCGALQSISTKNCCPICKAGLEDDSNPMKELRDTLEQRPEENKQ